MPLTARLVGRLPKAPRYPSAVALPNGKIGVVAHGSYYLVGLNPVPGTVRPIKLADLDRDSASLGHDKADNSVVLYGGRGHGMGEGDGTLADCARIHADTGAAMPEPTFTLPINLAECGVVEEGGLDLIVGGFDSNEVPRRFVCTRRSGAIIVNRHQLAVGCAGNAVRINDRVYVGFDSFLPDVGPLGMPFLERATAGGLSSGAEQFAEIDQPGWLRVVVGQEEGNDGFWRLGAGAGSGNSKLWLVETGGHVTTLGDVEVSADDVLYAGGGIIPFAISGCPLIDRTHDDGHLYAIAPTITVFFDTGGQNAWPTDGVFAIKVV